MSNNKILPFQDKNDLFSSFFNLSGTQSSYLEDDGSMMVTVEVPGFSDKDIEITIDNNFISVKGERNNKNSISKISKYFSIPEGYQQDNVIANLENGLLSLKFFPLKQKEIKKIPINVSSE